jgi:hypothetical protein
MGGYGDQRDYMQYMNAGENAIGFLVSSGKLLLFFAGPENVCFPSEGDGLSMLYNFIKPLHHTLDRRACPSLYVEGVLRNESFLYLLHRIACCAVDHFPLPKEFPFPEPYVYQEERKTSLPRPSQQWLDRL